MEQNAWTAFLRKHVTDSLSLSKVVVLLKAMMTHVAGFVSCLNIAGSGVA